MRSLFVLLALSLLALPAQAPSVADPPPTTSKRIRGIWTDTAAVRAGQRHA